MAVIPKAVVLLSGGLDSSTVLAMACAQGFAPYALSFAYGQRQVVELDAARCIAEHHDVAEHRTVTLDLRGGSALTGSQPVPKGRTAEEMSCGIPDTYVPARNTIMLAHALGWAEMLGAFDIFLGVNAVDYSGYPDCRPEFIKAFEHLANRATGAAIEGQSKFRIHAPLMHLSKSEIIKQGVALGVDYGRTHSCYDPVGNLACGACDACILRREGFMGANVTDPTPYVLHQGAQVD